jgi:hypothetical protein
MFLNSRNSTQYLDIYATLSDLVRKRSNWKLSSNWKSFQSELHLQKSKSHCLSKNLVQQQWQIL